MSFIIFKEFMQHTWVLRIFRLLITKYFVQLS
jgi:hypothetical protein